MEELALVDKKILSMLEYNPRVTFKEIAKACHLSKDTIKYRINRLEKEKIITQYTCYIDYKKLGNQSYKLYLKLNGTTEQREKLKEYLRKQKNVFAIFDSSGNWNFAVALFAKTHQDFNAIENSLLEQFGDIITDRKFCTMIDAQLFQKNLLGLDKRDVKEEEYLFWGEIENKKLDDIDKKLIKILHENSKTSLVDISEKIKLSIDAVKNRIQKLKENKIVNIYRTGINYEKLGFDSYKLLFYPKIYSEKIEKELIDFFRNNKNCIDIIRTIGPWKLEVEFLFKKTTEMDKLLDELYNNFKDNILDIDLSIFRNEEILACNELLLE
jgi:Lrp/AsnC family leucine-responsive transcriptional regulator